jgi:hypothetical protein
MYIQSFQSPAGSKITVTNTANNIFDLINTAQSTTLPNAGFSSKANAIIIQPEDGDIRVLFNNQVPTATNGFKISMGTIATLPNIPLASLQLIRTGSADVVCSIQVGLSDASESVTISGSGGGGGAASGSPAVGNPVQVGGVFNSTAPTLADGDVGALQLNSKGDLSVTLGTYLSGEDASKDVIKVEQRYTPFAISTATTTTILAAPGFLHEMLVIGGTLGNVTVYNNTAASGTVLLPTVTPVANGVLLKDILFTTGLTIVTAAATVIVGSYRP